MTNPYPLPRETRTSGIFVGSGAGTYGPFSFKIWDAIDVVAEVDRGTGTFTAEPVTVTRTSGQLFDNFTVTFSPALAPTHRAIVQSRRLHERSTDVTRGGAISTPGLEGELSRQSTVIQELRRDSDNNRGGLVQERAERIAADNWEASRRIAGDLFLLGLIGDKYNKDTINPHPVSSVAAAKLRTFDPTLAYLWAAGFGSPGDGGDALYVKASSAPSHLGAFQSLDGVWWEIAAAILTPAMFGAFGSPDDTTPLQAALSTAIAKNRPLRLQGDYTASILTITGNIQIEGSGSITKKAGTTGHLINANGKLVIKGDIILDQNKANCPNGAATPDSDCSIRHTGAVLYLDGVTLPASVSANVRTNATELCVAQECKMDGGYINLLALVGVNCKVHVSGGEYSNASRDDAIQIHNSLDIIVQGVEAHHAARSGIVVSASAGNVRIVNNHCHDNKIEVATTQGGWGIVASVSSRSFIIANNNCIGNQRGGVTADTYTSGTPAYTDAHFAITNNIIDGEGTLNPSGYCTTGISVNGAQYGVVSGNYVRRARQGILSEDPKGLTISGNTIREIGSGAVFFVQTLRGIDILISGNTFDVAGASSATGAIGVFQSSHVSVIGNTFENLTGDRPLIRVTNSPDTTIRGNTHHKTDAGTGYMFWLANDCSRLVIADNHLICTAASYSYYIVATGATLTAAITQGNNIRCTGIQTNPNRYILNGAAMNADDDNINGVKNYFSAAPTMFTPLTGATAGIAGVLKMYNGSAWV